MFRRITWFVPVLAMAAALVYAQPPAGGGSGRGRGGGGGGRGPALVSPQVNADHTITLRFRAPNAKEVAAIGEIDGKDHPMTKDDSGTWSVTIGPLAPDVYNYQFRVDGIVAMDPQNPQVKLGFSVRSRLPTWWKCLATGLSSTTRSPYPRDYPSGDV